MKCETNTLRKKLSNLLFSNVESYVEKTLKQIKNKRVYLFGVKKVDLAKTLSFMNEHSVKVRNIVDNNKANHGLLENGIKYIGPSDIIIDDNTIVVICAYRVNEIYKQLIELGIKNIFNIPRMGTNIGGHEILDVRIYRSNRDKLMNVFDLLEDDLSKKVLFNWIKTSVSGDFNLFCRSVSKGQYYKANVSPMPINMFWPSEIFKLGNNEVFVEAGVAEGATINNFISSVDKKYKKIIGLEPDMNNCNILVKKFEFENDIEFINKGLSDTKASLAFYSDGLSSKIVESDGYGVNIDVIPLDDLSDIDELSLFVMDVEGYEVKALSGARSKIKKSMPKLSVCLYHRPEHIWEVPLLIKNICPKYKIYIRQYTDSTDELVCHATI